ncbi:832_t:CDS:2 [Acaulospora morrowiae]|uniref:832_t:CDS:1 n=1 Tax=Acaulospora morrowiae TaxID=94023 RepID=A0A9N9GB45_9GLOM|nr:832_t:CDS:2 [Acaulospora morrowiae]
MNLEKTPAIATLLDGGISQEMHEKQMKSYRLQLRNILLPIIYNETTLVATVQDVCCLPRPRSPPVQRLLNAYHLEYGLPSTHTTNSVSIALFCLSYLLAANNMNSWIKYIGITGLFFYCAIIVLGRIYCGMHGFIDVTVGVIIGIAIWWIQLTFYRQIDDFILSNSWFVPISTVLGTLFLIYIFPEPMDQCPCHEDCISCIGVATGMILGNWRFSRSSYSLPNGSVLYDYNNIGFFLSCARVIFGLSVIFAFRIVMKKLLYIVLRPIYSFIHNDGCSLTKTDSAIGINDEMNFKPSNDKDTSEPAYISKHHTVKQKSREIPFKFSVNAGVKLFVYTGIAWIATDGIPVLFEVLGMGVKI